MAILSIKKYPDTILRQKAKKVIKIKEKILVLINDMIETMLAKNGIGIAANQIGALQRIIVINITPPQQNKRKNKEDKEDVELLVLINPEILSQNGDEVAEEGCLSLPEIKGEVNRAYEITVTGLNINGEILNVDASGLIARIIQHEIDHLNGILFIDRMNKQAKQLIKDELNLLEKGYKS